MSAILTRLVGFASLQGAPLVGYRRFGVPTGGAFDQESLRLGNALLGNEPKAPAIEVANAALEISFSIATRVAVIGASVGPASNSCFDVPAGGTLALAAATEGVRAYVCVAGGWTPEGANSRLAAQGRVLGAGDVLLHLETPPTGVLQRLASPPSSLSPAPIRVIAGPNWTPEVCTTLRVSNSSDRTGIRLDALPPRQVPELASEPACVGAVQLTASGQLIAIGPDGPTIGGYPKVAVVCSADLDRLAHLRPGQDVCFEQISLPSARKLAAERRERLQRLTQQIGLAARARL